MPPLQLLHLALDANGPLPTRNFHRCARRREMPFRKEDLRRDRIARWAFRIERERESAVPQIKSKGRDGAVDGVGPGPDEGFGGTVAQLAGLLGGGFGDGHFLAGECFLDRGGGFGGGVG